MPEYCFKSKKTNISIEVRKESDGEGKESRVLSFSVGANSYGLVKKLSAIGKEFAEMAKSGISIENYETVVEKERAAFELLAPGKWDEYFEFLDEDITNIAELLKKMIETFKGKAIKMKESKILPEVPDGEEV